MARPFENQTTPRIGKDAYCDPVWIDHPTIPGRKVIKRDEHRDIVFTAESLARYARYVEACDRETGGAGPSVTDANPVLGYFRDELAFHRDPTKVRPRSGPHSSHSDIPKDVLRVLEREDAPDKGHEKGAEKRR